jgi:membrane protease subunit (stomatin/prohibitin family)
MKGRLTTGGRGSNNKGSDNVITSGSGIVVADGQAMAIVSNGIIVEFASEPGGYTFDEGADPSIFAGGGLMKNVEAVFKEGVERFKRGGSVGKDQRVYFFNTKELIGNKYGTPTPIPFRVVDKNIGLDVDISIRCNGEYSYRMTNPILFYTNVTGNVSGMYTRSDIDSQLKTELLTALQPVFGKISAMGVRHSELPAHAQELADELNKALSSKWRDLRGIEVVSFGVNAATASEEDMALIKELQLRAVMRDPNMAAATLVGAQADAMRAAASNDGGAMMGFMGLGMAQQAGGANAGQLFGMGGGQAPPAQGWPCGKCGKNGNTGRFCSECGAPNPALDGWNCTKCGKTGITGQLWDECGSPRPTGAPVYKCNKCGWEPEDPKNPPKFCPECGDIFDESDAK